jgi:deferrochelatase/peroxidase EfeB
MRLGVDLRAWRKLSQQQQELIVGRSKISGCPVTGVDGAGLPVALPACPFAGTHSVLEPGNDAFREAPANVDATALASHIQRANHHLGPIDRDVSRRIYRQGYEFLEPPQPGRAMVAGLNFVSFQDTLERLFFVLTRPGWLGSTNFGGTPGAGLVDSLLSVYAAGVFLCPPVTAGEAYPGQSVFA